MDLAVGRARSLLAGIALVILVSGMHAASASSLGTFDDVVLDAASIPAETCTADVTLYDSTGSLILLDNVLATLTTIGYVELAGVEATCLAEVVPTVIVIGDDNVLDGSDEMILASIPLSLLESSPETYDVLSLGSLLPLGSSVSEVRVAFTPV